MQNPANLHHSFLFLSTGTLLHSEGGIGKSCLDGTASDSNYGRLNALTVIFATQVDAAL